MLSNTVLYVFIPLLTRQRRNEEPKVGKQEKRHYARTAILESLTSPWEKEGKKGKKEVSTRCSYLVTHPSTNPTETGLTSLSGQHNFYSFVRVQEKVSKLTSCMDFRMIQAMIKYFERSAVERIEDNSNDASRSLHCQTLSSMCLYR